VDVADAHRLTELLTEYRAGALALASLTLAVLASLHIVQRKRDPRAAAAWLGLVWLVPFLGCALYLVLGVNRIRRRARQLTGGELEPVGGWRAAAEAVPTDPNLRSLSALVGQVTGLPLTAGNDVAVLDAPQAHDLMRKAIDGARESVYLGSYIFGNDAAGIPVADALINAHRRGVRVRVLVDGVGALYSLPTIVSYLKRQGVVVHRFLHSLAPWRMPYMNLRNHRKIMVVDRQVGFTGGMNIRAGYLAEPASIRDLHFRLQGPVVSHLLRSFTADWYFACRELVDGAYRGPAMCGTVMARGISGGPDADFDKRRLALLGALNRAEHRIRIMTPYFVPDQTLQSALNLARLRGVEVDLFLPQKNNLRIVQWASLFIVPWLLRQGVNVYLLPPPFDHSKLMVVDDSWVMLGSGNWDARSLTLNFEFDVECYCSRLGTQLSTWLDQRQQQAQALDQRWADAQGPGVRLRNAMAHLLEPYL
jgi:cardiolipin synthase